MAELALEGVTKVYDDAQGREVAVEDLSITVDDGEFACLVGPSGCGKSTTLRMIAGLEPVTDGTITLDGDPVHHLAPSERDVAMVFQNYALYPKMTARENMAYGLKHAGGVGPTERRRIVEDTADLLGITDVLTDRPAEMSGGQKQRVALGRAIVRDPTVFLLDEPLSNLDAKLRSEMRRELQRIHEDLGITTVYVTHDQKEAMTMADRVAILDEGRLQQVADPETAYEAPTNRFVGEFLGSPAMNTVTATVGVGGELTVDDHPFAAVDPKAVTGYDTVVAGVRPEDVTIVEAGSGTFDAPVIDAEYQGDTNFVFLDVADQQFAVRAPRSVHPARASTVGVSIPGAAVYLFDPDTGATLQSPGEH
ncbi:MAG: ABC transporter ATP-binding protein [Halobacteriaceae archaeon]